MGGTQIPNKYSWVESLYLSGASLAFGLAHTDFAAVSSVSGGADASAILGIAGASVAALDVGAGAWERRLTNLKAEAKHSYYPPSG